MEKCKSYRRLEILSNNPLSALNKSDFHIVQGLAIKDAILLANESNQSVLLTVNGRQINVAPKSDIDALSKLIFD